MRLEEGSSYLCVDHMANILLRAGASQQLLSTDLPLWTTLSLGVQTGVLSGATVLGLSESRNQQVAFSLLAPLSSISTRQRFPLWYDSQGYRECRYYPCSTLLLATHLPPSANSSLFSVPFFLETGTQMHSKTGDHPANTLFCIQTAFLNCSNNFEALDFPLH